MPRAGRILFVILLIALGAFVRPAEAGRPKVYRIAGAGHDAEGKVVPQVTLAQTVAGVKISIRYLDDAARRAALESIPGMKTDLFPEHPPEGVRGQLVFALEIDNEGDGDLLFEPGQGRLITDRQDAEVPYDYTVLYGLLAKAGDRAPSLDQVERAVFSRAATIKPGGAVRKLLVFSRPGDDHFKRFHVRLGALHLPEGDADVSFEFRKFRVEAGGP